MKNIAQNDTDVVSSHNSLNKHCVLILYRTEKTAWCTDTTGGSLGWDNNLALVIICPAHFHCPGKITCCKSHMSRASHPYVVDYSGKTGSSQSMGSPGKLFL